MFIYNETSYIPLDPSRLLEKGSKFITLGVMGLLVCLIGLVEAQTSPPSSGQVAVATKMGIGFSPTQWSELFSPPEDWAFYSGDFNADGKADVVAYSFLSGVWQVGLSDGKSFKFSQWGSMSAPYNQWEHFIGDFDADGRKEIVSFSNISKTWTKTTQLGNDKFSSTVVTAAYAQTGRWDHLIGEINNDGSDDILSYNLDTKEWRRQLSQGGSGRFISVGTTDLPAPLSTSKYMLIDLNGDTRADLAELKSNGVWSVRISLSNGTFTEIGWTGSVLQSPDKLSLYPGDFDGDGRGDIAAYNTSSREWSVSISKGVSFETSVWSMGTFLNDGATHVVLDTNGDGLSDIVSFYPLLSTWIVLTSDGLTFSFPKQNQISSFPLGRKALVGDFDGDSVNDLAWFKSDVYPQQVLPGEQATNVNSNPSTSALVTSKDPVTGAATVVVCGPQLKNSTSLYAQTLVTGVPGQLIVIKRKIDADPDGPATQGVVRFEGKEFRNDGESQVTLINSRSTLYWALDIGFDPGDNYFVQICKQPLPNLTALTPTFDSDGGVIYGYNVSGTIPSGMGSVSVFATIHGVSPGNNGQDVPSGMIGSCPVVWTSGNHYCKVSREAVANLPGNFSQLLTDIPPGQYEEPNGSDNKARLQLSNATLKAPVISSDGFVRFEYDSPIAPQLESSLVYFYSTGPKPKDIISNAVLFATTAKKGGKSGSQTVQYSGLNKRPANAKYIIGILDGEAKLREANEEDNFVSMIIPDVTIDRFEWSKKGDLLIVVNSKGPTAIPVAGFPIAIYPSDATGAVNEKKRFRVPKVPQLSLGDNSIIVPASWVKETFGAGKVGQTLFVKANFDDSLLEINDENNTLDLLGGYTPTVKPPAVFTLLKTAWVGVDHTDAWALKAGYTADDGLRISGIRFNDQLIARSFYLPYFSIITEDTGNRLVRGQLKVDGNEEVLRSRLVETLSERIDLDNNGVDELDPYVFRAVYIIDRLAPGSRSYLRVAQEYSFYPATTKVAFGPTVLLGLSDYLHDHFRGKFSGARFIPKVTYNFIPANGDRLNELRIPQRLDFQLRNKPNNIAGLFKDVDIAPSFPSDVHGNPLLVERAFRAIDDGKGSEVDNLHLSDESMIDVPTFYAACDNCIHMHWRWGTYFNFPDGYQGKPIIPYGSRQSVGVGITRRKRGEEDPQGWRSLLNREKLVTRNGNKGLDIVFWYEGIGKANFDTFFSHGGFVKKPLKDHDHEEHEHLEALATDGDHVEVRQLKYRIERGATVDLPVLDSDDDEDIDPAEMTMQILQDKSSALKFKDGVLTYSVKAGTTSKDEVIYRLFDPEGAFRHYVVTVFVVPKSPSNLKATPEDGTNVRLTWKDNSDDEDRFVVESSTDGTSWVLQENVPRSNSSSTSALIQSLKYNKTYYFRVVAISSSGERSQPTNLENIKLTVSPPSNLKVAENKGNNVSLTWIDNSLKKFNFVVEKSLNNVNWSDQENVPANSSGAKITGLSLGTTYYYRVKAVMPDGQRSEPTDVVTVESKLNGPTSLSIREKGTSSVKLRWQNNSDYESNFVVESSRDGNSWSLQENVPAKLEGAEITGMSRNTKYYFRVRAALADGQRSAPSNQVEVILEYAVPSAPSGLGLASNGQNSVRINWRDNSLDEAYFVVQYSTNNSTWNDKENVPADPLNGALIERLSANTTYFFRVRASNADGKRSDASNVLEVKTQDDTPEAPTNLVTSEIAKTTLRLKWRDNSSDEASFVVQISKDNNSWTDKENVPANPANGAKIEGLAANTQYYFRVRSVGKTGKRSGGSNVVVGRTTK